MPGGRVLASFCSGGATIMMPMKGCSGISMPGAKSATRRARSNLMILGYGWLWMPGSKLALEQLILERRIRLRRSPVLIAAMMSAGLDSDPFGNAWFSKRKAVNRIDALIALAMAVGAATTANVELVPTSPWDDPSFSLAHPV